jgi:Zn-dependent peptidase ImmA (M78 family)
MGMVGNKQGNLRLVNSANRKFNPDLLEVARDIRGRTQSQVAKAADVTQALLSKVEHGLVEPSPEVVARIAMALRFPPGFFYQRGGAQGLPPYHYRKRKKLSAKILSMINAEIEIRRRHLAKLLKARDEDPLKPIPQYDVDAYGGAPAEIARLVREYWLMPRGPVRDLCALIENAGGIVVPCSFGTGGILDGVSFRQEGMPPLIFIDRHIPGDRFAFTLAHELGHLIMHSVPVQDEVMEDQADAFASEFLMPAKDIRPYLANPSLPQLAKVKAYWRVAISALLKRAGDLELVSSYQAKEIWMQYSRAGYRRQEPVPIERDEPHAVDAYIQFHMRELGYSVAEMSSLLLLKEDEFEAMYLKQPRLRVVSAN